MMPLDLFFWFRANVLTPVFESLRRLATRAQIVSDHRAEAVTASQYAVLTTGSCEVLGGSRAFVLSDADTRME